MSRLSPSQLILPPGSVTAPAILGEGSTTTGFYFIDANTIGVTVNGVKVGEFNANGSTVKTQTAIFEHQVAPGVGGGTATSGSWLPRLFTTTAIRNDNSFAVIGTSGSGSSFTLPSGSYIFKANAIFNNTNTTQTRIRNTTLGTTSALGTQVYLSSGSSSLGSSEIMSGIITVSTSTVFELQYRVSTTQNTIGLGNYDASFDEQQVFARLIIEKVG